MTYGEMIADIADEMIYDEMIADEMIYGEMIADEGIGRHR